MATTKKATPKKAVVKKAAAVKKTAVTKAPVKKAAETKAPVKKVAAKKTPAKTSRKKTLSRDEFLAVVREKAYEIYLSNENGSGDEITDWLAAEAEVSKKYKVK